MRRPTLVRLILLAAAAAVVALLPADGYAQQSGHNLAGDAGLESGTQAPPGLYAGFVYYGYSTDKLKNDNGDTLDTGGSVTVTSPTLLVSWVTNTKFLGANVGGTLAVPGIKDRIDAFSLDVDSELAVTDIFIQPINLGWHFDRADVTAGYGVYVPTGDFTAGGDENSGLGMFTHEISLGTTVHLNKAKTWHAAATGAYEIHARKPGIDIKVGDLLTIEGGVGRKFIKPVASGPIPIIANLGLAYYIQYKVTEDSGTGIRPRLRGLKDRAFGVGPEFNIYVPQIRGTFIARYVPEFGARNTTQGHTFFFGIVFNVKSFVPMPEAQPAP